MSAPLPTFGDCLRQAREQAGLSVRELAGKSGVSFSLISALENGRRSAGPDTVKRLASALHLRGPVRNQFVTLGNGASGRQRVHVSEKRKGMQVLRALISAVVGIPLTDVVELLLEYRVPGHDRYYDLVVRTRANEFIPVEIKNGEVIVLREKRQRPS